MLRLGDDRRRRTEALVAESRARHADAVHVASRDTQGSGETDEQAVEIGALSAEIAALQHRLDVAGAAAAGLRVAHRVLDDPFVDRPPLFEIVAGALGR